MTAEERLQELKNQINYHMDRYYNQDEPEISDYEYDLLMQELKALEKEHPELVTEDSPTRRIGGTVKREAGVTVRHRVPMLSIQDVFAQDEVTAWVEKVKLLHPDAKFCVEQKIDGLSMSLRYENGRLTMAETRGDGTVGEDVTANALVIPDVLHTLQTAYPYLEVRGEVYMTHADLDRTNREQEEKGKKIFANPRNCAAGTLRQLDSQIVRQRGLSMFVFNVQDGDSALMQSHSRGMESLRLTEGMKTIEPKVCETAEEILQEIDRIGALRGTLDYDIDGAVIKIDQVAYRSDFTAGSKYSPGHIAYKYPPEEKETVLREIELSVGRTGRINPTAVFDPISLCGTTVSRATLHNQDFIDKLGIGIGDTLVIFKSGEIIPKVKAVTRHTGERYQIPAVCPVCGEPVVREPDTADIRCVNTACPAQLERLVSYFVSRECMDIKGFGERYVKALIEEGYLKDYADIYNLKQHREALIEKGLIGKEKNTDKLLQAIDASKENDPVMLLTALGIQNVGRACAKELMKHYAGILQLAEASEAELNEIPDVGIVTARTLVSFFENPHNRLLLEKLQQAGVNMTMPERREIAAVFAGLTFVITGTLPTLGRKQAQELIEKYGGKCSGSVSKKTNYVLAGEAAGSKLDKAVSLGIKVISEEELFGMLPETAR